MSVEAHRGAEDPGVTATRSDARIERITDLLLEVAHRSPQRPARDSQRAAQLEHVALGRANPLTVGVVVHAVPHINWYKVQMGEGGWIGCRRAVDSSCVPLGPRVGNAIASGSRVIVWKAPHDDVGTILGVVPHQLEDPLVAVPGWLSQGSAAGMKREPAHRQPIKGMFRQGGIADYSCQSPIDATTMDLVWVTELGLAFHMSPFEVALRVNEMCGLFLNYFDSHAVFAGWNMEHVSAAHQLTAGHDEGECRFKEEVSLYPWEAAGLYAQGTDIAEEVDDDAVHFSSHKGKVDLPDGGEDAQPAYRTQRHGGYEGQGGLRSVSRPGSTSGRRTMSDGVSDHGLFCESIGADGSALYQSAKSVFIVKRGQIAQPRQVVKDESAEGDEAGSYKASSFFGSGSDHKIGDVQASSSLLKVAGVSDLLAHACNWKRLHPFHYRDDYDVPQASECFLPRVNENLDFDELSSASYMQSATPVRLNIDHRYNEVEYYMRESFLALLDEGSVVLGGGCGERFAFHNGKVRIDCPADIELVAGRNIVLQGADIVIKAQDSVDVSASRKDVRLFAKENLQLGSGASILLDAKGEAREQTYQDSVGEDVRGGGVIIKSAGVAAIIAGEVYCRSTAGDVIIDAAALDSDVVLVGSSISAYVADAVDIHHLSTVAGEVTRSHRFAATQSYHSGSLVIGSSLDVGVAGDGNVTVLGSVTASADIGCAGELGDSRGTTVRRVPDSMASEARQRGQQLDEGLRLLSESGTLAFTTSVATTAYADGRVGNDDTIEAIGFSYRDSDDPGKQYGTTDLEFLESRWETIVRTGGGSGGSAWEENPVSYQGRELYPWPGREAWTGATVVRSTELTMHDAAAGTDRDRAGPYELAALGSEERVSMQSSIRVINSQ